MGTRSLTFIKDRESKEQSINIYKQYDGYPEGWGVQLSQYLRDIKVVNGYGMDQEHNTKIVNGVGCLIAKFLTEFKTKTGGIYVYPVKDKDLGQDYEYHISVDNNGGIEIKIKQVGYMKDDKYISKTKTIFEGTPTEVISKYGRS